MPKCLPPTANELASLDAMRAWIYQQAGSDGLPTCIAKLDAAQTQLGLLTNTDVAQWKIAAVGVVLGDALQQASEGQLHWVMVGDEQPVSPALQWRASEALVYPITAVRERLNANEHVQLHELFAEYLRIFQINLR